MQLSQFLCNPTFSDFFNDIRFSISPQEMCQNISDTNEINTNYTIIVSKHLYCLLFVLSTECIRTLDQWFLQVGCKPLLDRGHSLLGRQNLCYSCILVICGWSTWIILFLWVTSYNTLIITDLDQI